MHNETVITPEVGMGATYCIGSDRYAVTVVKVQGTTIVWTRQDKTTRVDKNGYGENQRYINVPNPEGQLQKFTLRRNGTWRAAGRSNSGYLQLGERRTYQDPAF